MIRLAQRRLIIPRGDTGQFSIPALISDSSNAVSIFSIFNEKERIWTHEYPIIEGMVTIKFEHEDTKDLPLGIYNWDIKIYVNPRRNDAGWVIDGDEVDSYYAGFKLPECEITRAPIHERG